MVEVIECFATVMSFTVGYTSEGYTIVLNPADVIFYYGTRQVRGNPHKT